MGKMRIGFVGVGSMGQMAHLRNYVTIGDCEIVALAEIRPELGASVARRYGVPKVYADHRELLAKEQLDGVVASQPFSRHAVLLPEIYPKVKHLFTEKPVAIGVESAEKLAAAAKAAGCVHMVGYHKRSDPATMLVRKTIDEWKASGALGRLRYVRILMPEGDWVANGFLDLLRSSEKLPALDREPAPPDMDEATAKQYIAFVNYYIHQVNLMRHLLGEPYRVTYAEKSGVLLAVESASGVAGLIEMTPYRTTIEWEESALIGFEKGYIKLDLPAPVTINRSGTVEIYTDPGNGVTPMRTMPTLPWVHAMRQQAIHFVKVCQGEMAPPCDVAEAAEDLGIARDYVRLRFG